MLVAKVINTKDFMNCLLKKDIFDPFEVRSVNITTFVSFEINGDLNKSFYENSEEIHRSHCLWSEIKPFAFDMIKGSRLPKNIKIIFSAEKKLLDSISEKASALFINITFENNEITIITGSSLKSFSLDKSVEFMWDQWVNEFCARNGLQLSEPEYEEN